MLEDLHRSDHIPSNFCEHTKVLSHKYETANYIVQHSKKYKRPGHWKSISGHPFVELGIVFVELSMYTLLVIIIK